MFLFAVLPLSWHSKPALRSLSFSDYASFSISRLVFEVKRVALEGGDEGGRAEHAAIWPSVQGKVVQYGSL